jgi:hypothetical protein
VHDMVTTYYTDVSVELYENIDEDLLPEGFKILYRLDSPIVNDCVRLKIEDAGAGPEFQDQLVEPVFQREDTIDYGTVVTVIDRHIVGRHIVG